MQVYQLQFFSALHVESKGAGEPAGADEFIRSDTLSAALCLAWSTLFPDAGPELFRTPPFQVSSAFPYIGEILMFPMPVWTIWANADDAARKKLKAVKWISQGVMNQVLAGAAIDPETVCEIPGGAVVTAEEQQHLADLCHRPAWAGSERQRVAVDRLGLQTEGKLFFFSLRFFAPYAGLYFVADMSAAMQPKFRAALDFLGDTGLGADRSSGLGHFRALPAAEFPLRRESRNSGWLTLSLFNPGSAETNVWAGLSAYNLTTRSGWIVNTTIGRPPIRAFTEGSYFSTKPQGRVVAMLDEQTRRIINPKLATANRPPLTHDAPRDFRALCLPCAPPPQLQEVSHDC